MANFEIDASFANVRRGDENMQAYVAVPRDSSRCAGGIVLAMHVWGVDASMRDAAERFAAAGFATIVPDLYARFGAQPGDADSEVERFLPFAKRLTAATVEPDIAASAAWIAQEFPDRKVAIAGFCMGGIMALRRACGETPYACAAVWYGSLAGVDAERVAIPIVASFGAADAGIPPAGVETFRAGLRVPNDVEVYEGAGHAFCDGARPSYDRDAAESSWNRSLAFLRMHVEG